VPLAALVEDQSAIVVRKSDDGTVVVKVPASGVNLDALERALLVFALETTGGNRSHAAVLLGLTRSALLYRINKHQIDRKPARVFLRASEKYSSSRFPVSSLTAVASAPDSEEGLG
jgi:hypothetical protein